MISQLGCLASGPWQGLAVELKIDFVAMFVFDLEFRVTVTQSTLEFSPIHCPNGRLGQDLDFGGFAFALKLPELLHTNLPTVKAKLGQTSSFPNGPQIWFPIGQ